MGFTDIPITVIRKTYTAADKLIAFADTNALLADCDQFQRPLFIFGQPVSQP